MDGKQPAITDSSKSIMLFNGAIYNYKKIADKKQHTSDTVALLDALDEEGLIALEKLDGMYAILYRSIVDETLVLARDLSGQKPLYCAIVGDKLNKIFCATSDLRCITDVVGQYIKLHINKEALQHYHCYGFTSNSASLVDGVFEVPPNTCIVIDCKNFNFVKQSEIISYKYDDQSTKIVDKNVIVKEIDRTLRLTVQEHLEADVPVGVLLSGGIDSSLISSYAAELSTERINAFTLRFKQNDFDESRKASRYAKHLNINHLVLDFPEGYALAELIQNVLDAVDQPFCDISSIPTFAISEYISNI